MTNTCDSIAGCMKQYALGFLCMGTFIFYCIAFVKLWQSHIKPAKRDLGIMLFSAVQCLLGFISYGIIENSELVLSIRLIKILQCVAISWIFIIGIASQNKIRLVHIGCSFVIVYFIVTYVAIVVIRRPFDCRDPSWLALSLSWLLLCIVVAVNGVLFFKKATKMKTADDPTTAQRSFDDLSAVNRSKRRIIGKQEQCTTNNLFYKSSSYDIGDEPTTIELLYDNFRDIDSPNGRDELRDSYFYNDTDWQNSFHQDDYTPRDIDSRSVINVVGDSPRHHASTSDAQQPPQQQLEMIAVPPSNETYEEGQSLDTRFHDISRSRRLYNQTPFMESSAEEPYNKWQPEPQRELNHHTEHFDFTGQDDKTHFYRRPKSYTDTESVRSGLTMKLTTTDIPDDISAPRGDVKNMLHDVTNHTSEFVITTDDSDSSCSDIFEHLHLTDISEELDNLYYPREIDIYKDIDSGLNTSESPCFTSPAETSHTADKPRQSGDGDKWLREPVKSSHQYDALTPFSNSSQSSLVNKEQQPSTIMSTIVSRLNNMVKYRTLRSTENQKMVTRYFDKRSDTTISYLPSHDSINESSPISTVEATRVSNDFPPIVEIKNQSSSGLVTIQAELPNTYIGSFSSSLDLNKRRRLVVLIVIEALSALLTTIWDIVSLSMVSSSPMARCDFTLTHGENTEAVAYVSSRFVSSVLPHWAVLYVFYWVDRHHYMQLRSNWDVDLYGVEAAD